MAAIALDDLTLGYDRHPAVHHVTASFAPGSLTAVVGPNGAGKSTLLHGISGSLRPLGGRIVRSPEPMALLPQQSQLDRSFPLSVMELVSSGLWTRTGAFGRVGRAHCARIETALAAVGLAGFERRTIGALSGGQMQRVLFARLLLQDAGTILLDEPFTAIDARTASDLMRIVTRWNAEGRTVLAVLHDLDTVRAHFPDTLVIARELIAHGATPLTLTADALFRARQTNEGIDRDAPVCHRAPVSAAASESVSGAASGTRRS